MKNLPDICEDARDRFPNDIVIRLRRLQDESKYYITFEKL